MQPPGPSPRPGQSLSPGPGPVPGPDPGSSPDYHEVKSPDRLERTRTDKSDMSSDLLDTFHQILTEDKTQDQLLDQLLGIMTKLNEDRHIDVYPSQVLRQRLNTSIQKISLDS